MSRVTLSEAQRLIGQHIYAMRKDGTVVTGKLMSIKGNELSLKQHDNGKVRTKAIIPLVLFDLLAIGTSPFAFGGFGGFGYGGGFWW
jgi:hypothetical protein